MNANEVIKFIDENVELNFRKNNVEPKTNEDEIMNDLRRAADFFVDAIPASVVSFEWAKLKIQEILDSVKDDLSAEVCARVPSRGELERYVLGVLILDHRLFDSIKNILTLSDFKIYPNYSIFKIMCNLKSSNTDFDIVTLNDFLHGNIEEVDINKYLWELSKNVPSGASLISCANRLKQLREDC